MHLIDFAQFHGKLDKIKRLKYGIDGHPAYMTRVRPPYALKFPTKITAIAKYKLGRCGGGGEPLFQNEKEIIMIIINVSFPIHFCPNSVKAGKECKPECPDIP